MKKTKEQLQTELEEWKEHAKKIEKELSSFKECEGIAETSYLTAIADLENTIRKQRIDKSRLQRSVRGLEETIKHKERVIATQAKAKNDLLEKHEQKVSKLHKDICHFRGLSEYRLREKQKLEARIEELQEKQTQTSTIEELVNVASKQKKKAKKYKRMYKDARQANFKLSERLIELESFFNKQETCPSCGTTWNYKNNTFGQN